MKYQYDFPVTTWLAFGYIHKKSRAPEILGSVYILYIKIEIQVKSSGYSMLQD